MVKRDGNGSCVWFVTLKNEMAHVVYKYYGSITKLRGKKIRTEGIMINFVFVIVKYKTNQENLQEKLKRKLGSNKWNSMYWKSVLKVVQVIIYI